MNKFLIDPDVVIWFLKGREQEVSLIKKLASIGDLFISVVSITEIRVGLRKDAEKVIKELQDIFSPISLDPKTGELAGEFRQKYNLGIADMLIAATAVASDAILVTRNEKHFTMPQITLYKF